jgi:GTP cyclohydrolase I
MLKDICSHNFTPFIGQSCVMYADNGMELPLLVKR